MAAGQPHNVMAPTFSTSISLPMESVSIPPPELQILLDFLGVLGWKCSLMCPFQKVCHVTVTETLHIITCHRPTSKGLS